MKKALTIVFLVSLFSVVSLQAQTLVSKRGAHQHEGFFWSFGVGPVFGEIKEKVDDYYINDSYFYSGTGAKLDFKIGGTVSENLILHATLTSAAIVKPKIESESTGKQVDFPFNHSIGEVLYGVGVTYYFMPVNVFLSSSIGLGRFVQTVEDKSYTSEFGVGFQLKVGKEWWIGNNWGIGIGATYSNTSANTNVSRLRSDRYSIMANVTFD